MTLKKFKYQKAEDIDTKFTSNLNVEYMNTLNYNTQKQYFCMISAPLEVFVFDLLAVAVNCC